MSAAAVRPVSKVARGVKAMEGAGVRITRTIGVGNLRVDPFLMLDEVRRAARPLSYALCPLPQRPAAPRTQPLPAAPRTHPLT